MKLISRYVYMAGVLDALNRLGRSASATEIYDWLVENGVAIKSDLVIRQKDGGSRFKKEVRWARKELFDAGILDAPAPGTWALSVRGIGLTLTDDDARAIISENRASRS